MSALAAELAGRETTPVACLLAAATVAAMARPRPGDLRSWALSGRRAVAPRVRRRRQFDRRLLVVVGLGGCAALALLTGPLLALIAVLVLTSAAAGLHRSLRKWSAACADRDALAAVRFLGAELAAGSSEGAALRSAASVAGDLADTFRAAAAVAERGGEVARVFDGHDPPTSAVLALGRAWRVRAGSGASLAGVIGHVEDDLTDRAATRRAVSAALAGPRSSALVLAGLPVVGVVMGAGMGAHPLSFLLDRGVGSLVLLVGVALDAFGLWWTDRIARRAEP